MLAPEYTLKENEPTLLFHIAWEGHGTIPPFDLASVKFRCWNQEIIPDMELETGNIAPQLSLQVSSVILDAADTQLLSCCAKN